MAHDDDVPADPAADRVGLTGARFRSRSPVEPGRPPARSTRFEIVLRGYHRGAVDEHLARQEEELGRLREALRASELRRVAVEEHAAQLQAELAARSGTPRRAPQDARPDRDPVGDALLRSARREAARIRVDAVREAEQVLEEARSEADRRRDRAERTAAAWTERVEQHLSRRLAELDAPARPGDATGN